MGLGSHRINTPRGFGGSCPFYARMFSSGFRTPATPGISGCPAPRPGVQQPPGGKASCERRRFASTVLPCANSGPMLVSVNKVLSKCSLVFHGQGSCIGLSTAGLRPPPPIRCPGSGDLASPRPKSTQRKIPAGDTLWALRRAPFGAGGRNQEPPRSIPPMMHIGPFPRVSAPWMPLLPETHRAAGRPGDETDH